MRTPQDIINRKEANQRYYQRKENQEQKRVYQKKYDSCQRGPDIYASPLILELHEAWSQENGYRNENLHAKNSERFINYEELKEKTESEKLQDELEPIVNAPMMDKE
jgi:hypothetical protein